MLNRRHFINTALCASTLLPKIEAIASVPVAPTPSAERPVYVVLWFDTEDYVLPRSDDAAKRIAEFLTRQNVRATFKVVGEKARVLEARGRRDVIEALGRHEIGYHANTHSQQPTISLYLRDSGWDDGVAEFLRRESPGVRDIHRIFGVTPSCYGQPGNTWAPQAYAALRQLGIRVYLDEASHVGLDGQPFYYGGLLNVFNMQSNLCRIEPDAPDALKRSTAAFTETYNRLRSGGGGTISIYYHPCEFIHREFWDAVNFSRGRNPPREEWKLPPVKSEAEIAQAFDNFERFIAFMKEQPGVRFVTASEVAGLYADKVPSHQFGADELRAVASGVQGEISFRRSGDLSLSAAEQFSLLNGFVARHVEDGAGDARVSARQLYGPARPFSSTAEDLSAKRIRWSELLKTVRDVEDYLTTFQRVPDRVWFGSLDVSPETYLATLAPVVADLIETRRAPTDVQLKRASLGATRYVAEDSPALWEWPVFPEGFHAPQLMSLARLQAWTLKPAILS